MKGWSTFTTSASGAAATNLWSALGDGLTGASYARVNALTVSDGYLYAGGSFSSAGKIAANNLARWNLTSKTWTPLGAGVLGQVNAIAVGPDGQIYVGGYFTRAGAVGAQYVARWNPSNTAWSGLGSGVNTVNASYYPTTVNAIAAHPNGDLFVGGSFNRAGGLVANGLARWSNDAWSALGAGVTGGTQFSNSRPLVCASSLASYA